MNRLLIIVAVFAAGAVAAQEAPPELRNNPFSRPPSEVIIDDRVSVRTDEIATSAIEVQATMIGSTARLVNVGGRILKIGDEVQGYRIAEIHEQYVVFERDGRDLTVYVKPLPTDRRLAESNEQASEI